MEQTQQATGAAEALADVIGAMARAGSAATHDTQNAPNAEAAQAAEFIPEPMPVQSGPVVTEAVVRVIEWHRQHTEPDRSSSVDEGPAKP